MRPPLVIENSRKNSVAVQRIRISRALHCEPDEAQRFTKLPAKTIAPCPHCVRTNRAIAYQFG